MNLSYILNHDETQPTSPNLIKYKPFWDDFTRNLTNQCWLPLKTTNEPLCPSHWDDSSKRLALGSWVTDNTTKSTSGNDSVPDGSIWRSFKDDVISLERNEDMSSSSSSSTSSVKPPAGKALKIRLYPNSEEKQKLLRWIGTAACWTYNQCLVAINSKKNKKYL